MAPANLVATASNSLVTLTWSPSATATNYDVKRSLVSGGSHAWIASTTATNYADAQVTNGTTYFYVVSAVNTNGEGLDSARVSATPEPPRTNSMIGNVFSDDFSSSSINSASPAAPAPTSTSYEILSSKSWTAGAQGKHRKDQFQQVELSPPEAALLHNLRSLPPTRFDDRQWQVLAALFEVLPIAVVQLRLAFQRAGAVDFIEVAVAARTALGPSDAPSDLAYALDYRIQHWLVDEFQDTSHSQFALLEALTAEWQRDDGRTVFLVGDPMQSIYAFRQAEVGLFLQARHTGLGSLPLTPLQLTVNFRSQAGLVEWVNDSFADAFPPVEDVARGAVTFESSVAFHEALEDLAVAVHAFPGKNYALEAARVLEIIRQSRVEDPRGSIAVLVRTRSHLLDIVAHLQQAGIRYRAIDIDPLERRPVVQDLLALTRALQHTADRPAWLAILRAPWCGLKLADLLALAGADRNAAVWDLVRRPELQGQLDDEAQQRLARFIAVMERALPLAGRLPAARLIEKTWMELGGPAGLDSSRAVEDADAFLNLLEKAAPGAGVDLEELHAQMGKLFAQPDPEADETLQLMTLHKSKGLEFDTVILPGLARTPRNDDASLLLWMDQAVLPGQIAPLLAPIKEAGAERDELYRWVQSEQSQKFDFEVTRLLYVAVTRARKRLHLLAHCGISQKTGEVLAAGRRTLLGRLWPRSGVRSTPPDHRTDGPGGRACRRGREPAAGARRSAAASAGGLAAAGSGLSPGLAARAGAGDAAPGGGSRQRARRSPGTASELRPAHSAAPARTRRQRRRRARPAARRRRRRRRSRRRHRQPSRRPAAHPARPARRLAAGGSHRGGMEPAPLRATRRQTGANHHRPHVY